MKGPPDCYERDEQIAALRDRAAILIDAALGATERRAKFDAWEHSIGKLAPKSAQH